MTRTGKSPRLAAHLAEPFLEIHPKDAQDLGIAQATLVEVTSPQGRGVFRALVTDRGQRGQVFSPMHWTRQNSMNSQTNALVAAVTDPVSGQPASKATMVTAKPFDVAWYGFLATKAAITPQFDYCTIARSATGWTAELAGRSAPQDWSAFLGKLIGQPEAEISSYTDPSSGQTRLCVTQNGCIEALLFVGPDPIALARRTVAHAIGSSQPALAVLAGRPAADKPDEGAILCSCFSVGVNTIQRAIDAGATTVTEIGQRTCAGTNCGSCRPELAAILVAQVPKIAAE